MHFTVKKKIDRLKDLFVNTIENYLNLCNWILQNNVHYQWMVKEEDRMCSVVYRCLLFAEEKCVAVRSNVY